MDDIARLLASGDDAAIALALRTGRLPVERAREWLRSKHGTPEPRIRNVSTRCGVCGLGIGKDRTLTLRWRKTGREEVRHLSCDKVRGRMRHVSIGSLTAR